MHWAQGSGVDQAGVKVKGVSGMDHRSTPLSTVSHVRDRYKQPVFNQPLQEGLQTAEERMLYSSTPKQEQCAMSRRSQNGSISSSCYIN